METNLSRRGFLTGAAAAGALAAMGLAGCAPTPAAEGGTKTADTGAAAATSRRDPAEERQLEGVGDVSYKHVKLPAKGEV